MKKVMLKPICREIQVDLETPVSTFLKLQKKGAFFLLESAEKEENIGRYSFIGLNPSSILKIVNEKMFVDGKEVSFQKKDFLKTLRETLFAYEVNPEPDLPPFIGGWIGFLGYSTAGFFERLPSRLTSDIALPESILYLVKDVVIFDHFKHRAKITTLIGSHKEYQQAQNRLEGIIREINTPFKIKSTKHTSAKSQRPRSNFTEREFKIAVEKALEYIFAGDIFQIVLSHKFSGQTSSHPFDIYRTLRSINPSPYMFYLDFDDTQLIGSSPEALVRLTKGIATLRPIAGTKHRGKTHEEDIRLAEELLHDEKERAEHIMLVDLARNDLGKVCLPHSIKVEERMGLERYSHVMHLVSEVKGLLDSGYDALDLFKAAFPAGTVTGAPKIRAMELIEKLEKEKRGPYSGAVGYFGLDGDMDMCIAIRMIVHQQGKYFIQAGAGIVADSVPSNEYKETIDKMAGMFQTINISEGTRE